MFDMIIFSLLVAAVVCSIIELGLSADLVSIFNHADPYYIPGRYSSTFDFSLFASLWSLLVSVFLIGWAFFRGSSSGSQRTVSIGTLALNTLTMIFWLAGFAAVASLYNGYAPSGEVGAHLAFGVILWLIFLALTIITFLTAFGVIKSDRAGHDRIFQNTKFDANRGPTTTTTTTAV